MVAAPLGGLTLRHARLDDAQPVAHEDRVDALGGSQRVESGLRIGRGIAQRHAEPRPGGAVRQLVEVADDGALAARVEPRPDVGQDAGHVPRTLGRVEREMHDDDLHARDHRARIPARDRQRDELAPPEHREPDRRGGLDRARAPVGDEQRRGAGTVPRDDRLHPDVGREPAQARGTDRSARRFLHAQHVGVCVPDDLRGGLGVDRQGFHVVGHDAEAIGGGHASECVVPTHLRAR